MNGPVVFWIISLVVGLALGAAFFYMLYRSVRIEKQGGSIKRMISLLVLRWGLALLVFWLMAQVGVLPLLLTLAGFLVARFGATRIVKVGA